MFCFVQLLELCLKMFKRICHCDQSFFLRKNYEFEWASHVSVQTSIIKHVLGLLLCVVCYVQGVNWKRAVAW